MKATLGRVRYEDAENVIRGEYVFVSKRNTGVTVKISYLYETVRGPLKDVTEEDVDIRSWNVSSRSIRSGSDEKTF